MPARFYISKELWGKNILTGEEAHHALKVMRLKIGSPIELFNGEGAYVIGKVSEIYNKQLTFQVVKESFTPQSLPRIHLYQSIPKGKNMDLIIQKAVELGVNEIHPLITDHTIAVSGDLSKKTEKWRRVALEACKQCRQTWLPTVNEPLHFKTLEACNHSLKVVGALRTDTLELKDALTLDSPPSSVAILVGPEGDFTNKELEHAITLGFTPVTLGKLVLKAETASLYMISAVKYQLC